MSRRRRRAGPILPTATARFWRSHCPARSFMPIPGRCPTRAMPAIQLASVLPGLDIAQTAKKLESGKDFVYLDRKLMPK